MRDEKIMCGGIQSLEASGVGQPNNRERKYMCHECDDEGIEPQEFTLDMIPEEEQEEFLDFAVDKFKKVMEKAIDHDILFELITEWPVEKQAMFTFATVMEDKLLGDD
jgi:hypothetical protein